MAGSKFQAGAPVEVVYGEYRGNQGKIEATQDLDRVQRVRLDSGEVVSIDIEFIRLKG